MHKLIAKLRHKPEAADAHGHGRHHHVVALVIIAAVFVALVVLHLTGTIGASSH